MLDNRDIFDLKAQPNNDVLILCEHASPDLKGIKPLEAEKSLIQSFEGHDPGSFDLACYLSEQLQCAAISTNFSKLIIDPSLPISSPNLVREYFSE